MNHENLVPILDETQYSLKCLEVCVDVHKKFWKEMVVQEGAVLSVVVPIFNEQDSIELLHERIVNACEGLGVEYEIIFVDDGSQDDTVGILRHMVKKDSTVKVVRFRKNFGQTAAMDAGFQVARGQVLVSMDGDMQNDPADIPLLLEKIDEGCDVVCGWRKNQQDKFLSRRLPSRVANWIIGLMTGVKIRDNGFSLKAYRSSIIKKVALYGDLHRLGLFAVLGVSFKTTNCLESINALVEERCVKVDRWTNSNQRQSWLATALLDIEPRLCKVKGYRHLPRLRQALRRELKIEETMPPKVA